MQLEITTADIVLFEAGRRRIEDDTSDWLWMRGGSHGYGLLCLPGHGARFRVRTHVFAWAVASGSWPVRDERICHTCDVPGCTRNDGPEGTYVVEGVTYRRFGHLWLGTQAANLADMRAKGHQVSGDLTRARRYPETLLRGDQHHTHTNPALVPRGEKQPHSVLTERTVREVRRLYAAGDVTQQALADMFGVCRPSISHVLSRKTWAHVL